MSSSIKIQHFCNEVSTIVKWEINDFLKKAPKDKPTKLESDSFHLYKSRLSFFFNFYTVSSTDECSDFSSLYLTPKNLDNEKTVELKWKFWIENVDGKKIGGQEEFEYNFYETTFGCGTQCFIKHSELYPPESDFIKDNIVFMCCETIRNTSQPNFESIPLNDVEILKTLYETTQNGDNKRKMSIKLKNNKKIKIEKSLLALQSPFFAQILGNEHFDETQNNSIKIEDCEPEVFEAYVEFMYLKYITQENVKHVHELLKLADKYNDVKLKEECTQILTKNINKDNIFPLLKTCFTHNCPKLRESVFNYLSRNSSYVSSVRFLDRDIVFFLLITCFMYNCPRLKEAVLTYVSRDDSDVNFKDIMKTKEWNKFALENGKIAGQIIDVVFAKFSGPR